MELLWVDMGSFVVVSALSLVLVLWLILFDCIYDCSILLCYELVLGYYFCFGIVIGLLDLLGLVMVMDLSQSPELYKTLSCNMFKIHPTWGTCL